MHLETYGRNFIDKSICVSIDFDLRHFYPGSWNSYKENLNQNAKEMLNRKTKTRTKSKILPSGDLVEQTVITEVTETFSSPNCVGDVIEAVNKLSEEDELNDDSEINKITLAKDKQYREKGKRAQNEESLKGNSVMPFQTLGKSQICVEFEY